jgi:hypothetical protein
MFPDKPAECSPSQCRPTGPPLPPSRTSAGSQATVAVFAVRLNNVRKVFAAVHGAVRPASPRQLACLRVLCARGRGPCCRRRSAPAWPLHRARGTAGLWPEEKHPQHPRASPTRTIRQNANERETSALPTCPDYGWGNLHCQEVFDPTSGQVPLSGQHFAYCAAMPSLGLTRIIFTITGLQHVQVIACAAA